MSLSLSDYSKLVSEKIAIIQHDVEPRYVTDLPDIRKMSMFCVDMLQSHLTVLLKQGGIPAYPGLDRVFREAFEFLSFNLKKHKRWSFWHYTLVCVITSLPYAEMIARGDHKTIDLNKQEVWDNPDYRAPTLFFNFVAGKLYPEDLPKIIDKEGFDKVFTRNESTTERYAFFCKFLIRKIKLVTNEETGL